MRQKPSVISILLVLFLLKTSISISQSDTLWVGYNEYLEHVTDTSIKFFGGYLKSGKGWEMILKNLQKTIILMRGYYSDSTFTNKNGRFEYFYDNGSPKANEFYELNKPVGIWVKWDENSMPIDSSIYENGELKTEIEYGYTNKDLIIMYSFDDKKNKRSLLKYYFTDGKIKNETELLNEKAIDEKLYYQNGQLSSERKYDTKGKQISIKRFTENGEEISEKDYKKEQKKSLEDLEKIIAKERPEFKGGWGAFQTYVQQNLVIPRNLIQESGALEKVTISFYLNEFGKAEKIQLQGINDSDLLRNVERMLERMPAWDMKGKKSYGPVTTSINFIL